MKALIVAVSLLALMGCTDATNLERTKLVVCYSGGEIVFQDETNSVSRYDTSRVYVLKSIHTGKEHEVPMDMCTVSSQ